MYINIINPENGLEENTKQLNPIFYFQSFTLPKEYIKTILESQNQVKSNDTTINKDFSKRIAETGLERRDRLVVGVSETASFKMHYNLALRFEQLLLVIFILSVSRLPVGVIL